MSKKIIAFDGGGGRGIWSCFLMFLLSSHVTELWRHCDLAIGSSVGAVLAAALALDLTSHPEMQERFIKAIKVTFSLKNKDQPFFACMWNSKHKRQALKDVFGSYKLRDAKCPLAIVTSKWRGKMRVFLSTRASDANMDLATLLDAATAPPYFFSAVKIQGSWMIDGGVRHNTPVALAVICAKELWKNERFRMLNIGTRNTKSDEKEPSFQDPERVGLVKCLQEGILDTLMGVYDDTDLELVKVCFGKDLVLRIEPDLPPAFSDVSEPTIKIMKQASVDVWKEKKDVILEFLK